MTVKREGSLYKEIFCGKLVPAISSDCHDNLEGEDLMRSFVSAAFIASVVLTGFSQAQAMPVAPLDQAEAGSVIQVYGGCGWGGHRGPYGGCRALYNCPPGWHPGPYGRRCFPNRRW